VTLTALLQSIVLLVGGAGVGRIVAAFARKRIVRADAAETVADTASKLGALSLEQASAAHAEAASARAEAAQARRDAAEVQLQMARLNAEIEVLLARMRNWRSEIFRPSATLEGIRLMVGGSDWDPSTNGRP
jgi:hypothetical protein